MIPAMLGLTVAGTAINAISSIRQGQVSGDTAIANSRLQARQMIQQAQMAERAAADADFDVQAERDATAFDVARQEEQATAFKASQRVSIAGSGLEATGSPLLVMGETAKQLELDELAIKHAGEMRVRDIEDEARMLRFQAKQLREGVPLTLDLGRYQARAARQAGSLGATKSIISGGAQAATGYLYGYGNIG